MTPEQILKEYYGHEQFRKGQREAITAILSGRDVLAVMPTGAGKSVCYQIPALLLEGMTIVISPLISLMKDQVESLEQTGISAAYINSTISQEQYFTTVERLRNGEVKILYVAPERLMTESFLHLTEMLYISLIAVDESHCVSQWGQDFRQSYLDIPKFMEALPNRPICTAFTATATEVVEEDIIELLHLKNPERIKTGFYRTNLYFDVRNTGDKDSELLQLLESYAGKSGIVYCSTRKNVEEVCDRIRAAGFESTRYHAGLSEEERSINQDDFLYDRCTVMVATNAFGMGIDKSNVSFVIHYNMPKDMESYYQEAGRAGRDGDSAYCTLLYNARDVRLNQFLIQKSRDNMADMAPEVCDALIQKSEDRLREMTFYATSTSCLWHRMLNYFGERSPESCGNCSCCKNHYKEQDITLEAKKIISCVYRGQQRKCHMTKTLVSGILTGSESEQIKRLNLQSLSTYGIMKDISQRKIRSMIDHMTLHGYLGEKSIQASDFTYNELMLTGQAARVLRDEEKVVVRLQIDEKPKRSRVTADGVPGGAIRKSVADPSLSDEENALYEKLRQVRLRIANHEGVPPYMICTNASLKNMATMKPKNKQELQQVPGIGKNRAEKYGAKFIEIIKSF